VQFFKPALHGTTIVYTGSEHNVHALSAFGLSP